MSEKISLDSSDLTRQCYKDEKCAVFFVLSPIFFTFAAVMCDFLNRDVRFWKVDSADRWDSVGPKFSRMFLF